MPATTTTSQPKYNCPFCCAVHMRQSDLDRHLKAHQPKRPFRCPWRGCPYENKQKSNVQTHYRTHTQEKKGACPECKFKTVDPGSLTRHRKKIHEYVPKPRKKRVSKSTDNFEETDADMTTGPSRMVPSTAYRHHPYAHAPNRTVDSPSTTPSAPSSSTPPLDSSLDIPPELEQLIALFESLDRCDHQAQAPNGGTPMPMYWEQFLHEHPWPKPLYPATETSGALQARDQFQGQGEVAPQAQAQAQAHYSPPVETDDPTFLPLSHPASATHPEVPIYENGMETGAVAPGVVQNEVYTSTSGWETEGFDCLRANIVSQISAPGAAQYRDPSAWSLAQPCSQSEVTQGFDNFAPHPNSWNVAHGLSSGLNVGTGSPAWSSPCSSLQSFSPMSACPSMQGMGNSAFVYY